MLVQYAMGKVTFLLYIGSLVASFTLSSHSTVVEKPLFLASPGSAFLILVLASLSSFSLSTFSSKSLLGQNGLLTLASSFALSFALCFATRFLLLGFLDFSILVPTFALEQAFTHEQAFTTAASMYKGQICVSSSGNVSRILIQADAFAYDLAKSDLSQSNLLFQVFVFRAIHVISITKLGAITVIDWFATQSAFYGRTYDALIVNANTFLAF